VLRLPGAVFAGLNTSHGVTARTLTWRLRDISIIGIVRRPQVERLRTVFADVPANDARVIVMHHNPMKGELSQRHGLKDTSRALGAFADLQADLVLCGHDHQEGVYHIEHTTYGTIVCTAGTVSNRTRGQRPSAMNVITLTPEAIEIEPQIWSAEAQNFLPGPVQRFSR
jgi:3',5'-cyclic AMP phosphodiesterase CpdA